MCSGRRSRGVRQGPSNSRAGCRRRWRSTANQLRSHFAGGKVLEQEEGPRAEGERIPQPPLEILHSTNGPPDEGLVQFPKIPGLTEANSVQVVNQIEVDLRVQSTRQTIGALLPIPVDQSVHDLT